MTQLARHTCCRWHVRLPDGSCAGWRRIKRTRVFTWPLSSVFLAAIFNEQQKRRTLLELPCYTINVFPSVGQWKMHRANALNTEHNKKITGESIWRRSFCGSNLCMSGRDEAVRRTITSIERGENIWAGTHPPVVLLAGCGTAQHQALRYIYIGGAVARRRKRAFVPFPVVRVFRPVNFFTTPEAGPVSLSPLSSRVLSCLLQHID